MFEFILHHSSGSPATTNMFIMPTVVGIVSVALVAMAIILYGWRAGVICSGVGALLLGAGLIGDVVSHGGHSHERSVIIDSMQAGHDPSAAARLHHLDEAEATNLWHLPTGAGAGMLVAGLAGTAYLLWRRYEDSNPGSGSLSGSLPNREAA